MTIVHHEGDSVGAAEVNLPEMWTSVESKSHKPREVPQMRLQAGRRKAR